MSVNTLHPDPPTLPSTSQQPEHTHQRRKEKLRRSKDGCFSCRSRKKKCDNLQPVCASCERLGLECKWPIMGRDDKGRMVVVNRPPKRPKPDADGQSDAQREGREPSGSGTSGSHSGQGQWPARSTSPQQRQKQPSSASAPLGQTGLLAAMRMEDWAITLDQPGDVTLPPAAGPPLADPPGAGPARDTDEELIDFLMPHYQRSVQATQASASAIIVPQNPAPATRRLSGDDSRASDVRSAMYPQAAFERSPAAMHHLPTSAFLPSQIDPQHTASPSSAATSQVPVDAHPTQQAPPSPSLNMASWFDDALNGASPHTFAQSLSVAGFSPSLAARNASATEHDLANFSADDWLVNTPRPETGYSTSVMRTPALGATPLAAILSQPSPGATAFDVNAILGEMGRAAAAAAAQQRPHPEAPPAPSSCPPSPLIRKPPNERRPGDSPDNPIVPPLRKRSAEEAFGQREDHPQEETADHDFDVLSDDDSAEAGVDGVISRASVDNQGKLSPVQPSIGPTLSIHLPELPAFIATQAPLLIDYFLRKLAPLVSVLTPDPQSVTALSMAVSAGSVLRGGMKDGALRNGLGAVVERKAGNDLASCFLPMALESDSLLVGIVAWSATHLHDVGQPWREIAEGLKKDAYARADSAFREWESSFLVVGADADREAEKLLGTLIMLSEVEICRGSVEHWHPPLRMAQKIIQRFGGSKGLARLSWNGVWLLQNWAYHELTSSELPLVGPALDEETYKTILTGPANTFMGITMPIFQIISDIARLSASLPDMLNGAAEETEPRRKIESLLSLQSQIALLEARLDACYPTVNEDGESSTALYHFSAFRTYSLCARLYLKQTVSRSNAQSIANQTLVAQLLESIKTVLSTPFESSLLLPIFLLGVDALGQDRHAIRNLFNGLHSNTRIGNIQTAWLLVQEVWARNEDGERWVNWPALARDLGWVISFA